MKIHEYQAKQILSKYNVKIPKGEIAQILEIVESAEGKIGRIFQFLG